jgi:hypothetical protein
MGKWAWTLYSTYTIVHRVQLNFMGEGYTWLNKRGVGCSLNYDHLLHAHFIFFCILKGGGGDLLSFPANKNGLNWTGVNTRGTAITTTNNTRLGGKEIVACRRFGPQRLSLWMWWPSSDVQKEGQQKP